MGKKKHKKHRRKTEVEKLQQDLISYRMPDTGKPRKAPRKRGTSAVVPPLGNPPAEAPSRGGSPGPPPIPPALAPPPARRPPPLAPLPPWHRAPAAVNVVPPPAAVHPAVHPIVHPAAPAVAAPPLAVAHTMYAPHRISQHLLKPEFQKHPATHEYQPIHSVETPKFVLQTVGPGSYLLKMRNFTPGAEPQIKRILKNKKTISVNNKTFSKKKALAAILKLLETGQTVEVETQ